MSLWDLPVADLRQNEMSVNDLQETIANIKLQILILCSAN